MAFIPQQINIAGTNAPLVGLAATQGTGAQSSGGGSFMSVLTSMINGGRVQDADTNDLFGGGVNPFNDMLQGLDSEEGIIDPLMLSFIQQLMANPQQFQDITQGIMQTGDNKLQQIAQVNYGQLNSLVDFVKTFATRQNVYQPMTPEEISKAIVAKFTQSTQKSAEAMASTPITNMTSEQGFAASNNNMSAAMQEALNAMTTQTQTPEIQIKMPQVQPPLIETTLAQTSEVLPPLEQKTQTQTNELSSIINPITDGANKGISNMAMQESSANLLAPKIDKEGLQIDKFYLQDQKKTAEELIDNEIDKGNGNQLKVNNLLQQGEESINPSLSVQETEITTIQRDTQTASINTDKTDSAAAQTAANNMQHTNAVKNDQPVKETLHVSRIQEIDTRILKAVESGQNSLTIKLEPPELGSVQIKLVLADGMVRADVRVESSAVKDMMNVAIPQIKNTLENAGIKLSEFSVDIREEYYSDGRRQQQDSDNHKNKKEKKQEGGDSKPFDFFI